MKNILDNFLKLENKETINVDNFIEEINSITVNHVDIFKDLQERGKFIKNLLDYTNSKTHNGIITALDDKIKFNSVSDSINSELEPILHEKEILELEIMKFIINDTVSPLIYQMIQRDSIKQYNLPCEYMLNIYDIKNKTKKGLIEAIIEDSEKLKADVYIYKLNVNSDNIFILVYDNTVSIITKDKNVIDVYTLDRPDMIDYMYINFGENLENIHKINRFLLHIDRELYNIYMINYVRRYLFMATLFKL